MGVRKNPDGSITVGILNEKAEEKPVQKPQPKEVSQKRRQK